MSYTTRPNTVVIQESRNTAKYDRVRLNSNCKPIVNDRIRRRIRPLTRVVCDRIRKNTAKYLVQVLRSYISVSFTKMYDNIRRKIRSFTVLEYRVRIRSSFRSVLLRKQQYTFIYDTEKYDRNTEPCIT